MKKNFKSINKKIVMVLSFSIIIIMNLLYIMYSNQRDAIVNQQREELVNLSKVASIQLEEFFEGRKKDINHYFNNEKIKDITIISGIEKSIDEFKSNNNEFLNDIQYIYEENIYDYYSKNIDNEIIKHYIEQVIDEEETIIGPWIYSEKGYYNLNLIKAIVVEEKFQGIIVAEYNLSEIYDGTIGNIKVGNYGYCTLKDQAGIILMHGDEKQIGMDSLEGRKERYPALDPEGIERLVSNQLKGEAGSDIIESYWWGENEVKQVKKIIGYSPVKIGEYNWVVNSVMSYDEIADPIEAGMYLMILLMIIVIIISMAIIYYIIKMKYEKEEALIKLTHAEELNETVNKLRKHEENLGHNNRIQTLGIMSSMMVHDIKNMIMPIFIYTELIKEEAKENKNVVSDIEEIEKAANSCLNLSKSLLKYSTNKKSIEIFDSAEEARAVIKMIKAIIPRNINLKVNIADYKMLMNGNNAEFKQIILNLCTNSYQAMENIGGKLEVNYYKKENRAILEVKDTGIGIDKDIQEKIFEPFFTMKGEKEGTGLGLSIVSELVRKHNGYITLESEPMRGSKFIVSFNL